MALSDDGNELKVMEIISTGAERFYSLVHEPKGTGALS